MYSFMVSRHLFSFRLFGTPSIQQGQLYVCILWRITEDFPVIPENTIFECHTRKGSICPILDTYVPKASKLDVEAIYPNI